jgi:hypothetical protein
LDSATKNLPGRNEACHCGSGKKYKNCHLEKDERAARDARAKAAESAPAAEATEAVATSAGSAGAAPPRPKAHGAQPWKRGTANTRGFQRTSGTRKVGGGG